ncbi:AmiS/UreI family transporter [Kyrpidia spormannii]|uniref:Transporter protein AmiS2 n=1 Tax=Kyrpidia spormannii TaxID=2055160 RepID=A0ACA8ZCC3_9BACL|nr:AmiS/UreI family transporter [Kyrpidia spormannii]CAB3394872.1 putative transporter protein AmiS2 [Kyrpidia spormannii]
MANVGLLYVGAVLFVNALMLLGKIDSKSAGIFNLFVGALQVFTPVYLIMTAQNSWDIFSASGIFLFGFTYLYVGISNLTGNNSSGVGWYSLWVSMLAIGYSIVNFYHFGDIKFGVIWLMWAFLWGLFFLLLAQKRDIGRFTGWVTLIESWATCTIPAFLSMTGLWTHISATVVWIAVLFVLALVTWAWVTTRASHAPVAKSS